MLSNKKLVLDDGHKKQWQPQRQVHVEKKNTRATCVVEQHNLLQNQKVSRVVPVCVAVHVNK